MGTTGLADVRGIRIVYEWAGTAAEPDLVWAHGLSQTRAAEATLGVVDVAALPARVLRYDARGHGESTTSPEPDGYGWDQLAHDQLALADSLGIERYIAAGASMGCGTALHAALIAPDRITRCVAVIPPTAWESRAAQVDEWAAVASLLEREGVEPVIAARAQRALPEPLASDPTVRDHQAAALRAWDTDRLAVVMRGAAQADLPPRERLAAIAVPTMILAWSGDPVHPLSTAEQLADLIPRSTLHVATNAAELAAWTALVARFIT
jgi:pimeloyl-ACP methyl ester carboxylesterase